jgi:hypothetical protein
MRKRLRAASALLVLAVFLPVSPALCAVPATLEAAEQVIQKGEVAEFKITSNKTTSSELHAWCEIAATGSASLTFDGDHYVPLSEPAVGDIVTLSAGETRRYRLDGSVEANRGDAYIAFAFTDVPAAMCFPGMQCNGTAAGAKSVKVTCGNN